MKIPEENNRIFRTISMMLPDIILALFLIPISFVPISSLPSASAQIPTICNRSCQGHPIPFPFGFTDGCEIPLQCANHGIKVRVLNITPNSLLLDLPPMCNRRFGEATKLFGSNFAPTSHNELLLQNCSRNVTGCSISPSLLQERRFELQNCGRKIDEDIRCYSHQRKDGFLEFEKLNSTDCKVSFSSVTARNGTAAGSVEMDFRTVELGWWLEGRCGMNGSCSTHSNCTDVMPPVNGRSGYRCQCIDGYKGDGFVAGVGCRKGKGRGNYQVGLEDIANNGSPVRREAMMTK